MSLLNKFLDLFKSKPDEGSIPDIGSDAPDPDENTAREVETSKEAKTYWFTLFKIKF